MKSSLLSLLSLFSLLGICFISCNIDQISQPQPTTGKTIINELGEADGDAREKWIEDLHWSAPSDNWRNIEAQNRYKKHLRKVQLRNGNKSGDCVSESFANGEVSGTWCERGSNNQSGSIGPMYYDEGTNKVYAISAGGTLWKGSLTGNNWEPINEDLRFSWNVLEKIPRAGGSRLLAVRNKIMHYSDDDGYTWTASSGLNTYSDNWGRRDKVAVLNDSQNSIYFLMQEWKPGPWQSEVSIFKSIDKGVSFTRDLELGPVSLNDIDMVNPHNSNALYLIHRVSNTQLRTYKLNTTSGNIELLNTTSNPSFPDLGSLTGVVQNGTTHLYTYSNDKVYYSSNEGANWTYKGDLPASPWEVGLNVSAFDYTKLFIGGLECHRSFDSGASWTLLNGWGAYYSDPLNKLHADIMRIQFFEKSDNTEFMLISNHGGISSSYNHGLSTTNIGMSGLNVSQYYSVATDPVNGSHIYAGSQDQGFQRTASSGINCLQNFEQAISGDYGHLVFNDDGGLWMVYPDGWVSYWAFPETQGIYANFTMESSNEAAWIPFLMESPYANEKVIYMAGGNANGGSGSYIVKLSYANSNITATNHSSFNFSSSGGVLSSIEVSPLDNNKWYAATSNGKFYYSTNAGVNWTQTNSFTGPEQHYLYGSTILASKTDENTVYYGGSGYSNPGVYISTDGGVNFTPMDNGLPQTMIFKLVSNDTESHLFAATEAGPYIYSLNSNTWFDMSGTCAPAQTYWSVEFLEDEQIARFGTYGRGIWDFAFGVAVPVELNSFTARVIHPNLVNLKWQTASENNNDYFVVERSSDGQSFESIGQIKSKGNSTSIQDYLSSDTQPLRGTSYYRLKQVDRSGEFTYSDQVAITIKEEIAVNIYPNPVRANQALNINADFDGQAEFDIYNASGLLVKKLKISNRASINLDGLPSGNYFYQLNFDNEVKRGKIQVIN